LTALLTASSTSCTNDACNASLDSYCTQNSCDLTLDAAVHDKSLCPGAFLSTCGDYQAVTQSGVDSSTINYYLNGHLVAIEYHALTVGNVCLAGTGSFAAPACDDGAPITACMR